MDCFKLQAETLNYLETEHKNFTSIIKQITKLISIDAPILVLLGKFVTNQTSIVLQSLLGQPEYDSYNACPSVVRNVNMKYQTEKGNFRAHGKVDWVVDQMQSGTSDQCNKLNKQKISKQQSINTASVGSAYDAKSTVSFVVDQAHFCKSQRHKNSHEEIIARLSRYLWQILTKQSKTRLQKQSQLVNSSYLYFLISSIYNKIPQQNQLFQKLLKQYAQNFTNTTKYFIYIKVCTELQKINVKLVEDRDLGVVRNMCIELKEFMVRSQKKVKQKNKQINNECNNVKDKSYIHQQISQKQKSPESKANNNYNNPNPNKIFKQSIGLFDQQTLKNNKSYNNNFTELQNILNWKIQSCIILLTQILHKQPYNKQMLVAYLQAGKKLRKIGENQDKQGIQNYTIIATTTRLLQSNHSKNSNNSNKNNNNKNNEIRTQILQNILQTYSNILKYSHNLKNTKYFDIFTMQFSICYKYVMKFIGERQSTNKLITTSKDNSNNNDTFNNSHNTTNLNKTRVNFMQNVNKIKKQEQEQQKPQQQKQLLQSESQQFKQQLSFVNIKDKNKEKKSIIRQKNNKSDKNTKNNKNNNQNNAIDYRYIEQQLQQITAQKQKQSFDHYFANDTVTKVQLKYNKIQEQKKRRIQFHKTLDYLTNRSSPNSLLSSTSNSYSVLSKMHINLSNLKNKNGASVSNFSQDNRAILARQSKFPRKGVTNSEYSIINVNANNNSSKMLKQGNNPNSNSLYNTVFISTRQKKPRNQNSNNSNNKQPGLSKQIKVTGRVGTVIRHHSFKNQIIDLISITKRNIKPSKHFNEIKDADNNIYRAIISTEQRVTVLTVQKLQDQISYMHQVRIQKATPIEQQVLISTNVNDHRQGLGQRDDSYSFKGIGSMLGGNSQQQQEYSNNYGNGSNVQKQKIKQKQKQFTQLTMVQCYGHQIGFVKICSSRSQTIQNQNSISFSSYFHNIINAKLSITHGSHHNNNSNSNNNIHTGFTNNHGRNSYLDRQDLLLTTLKTIFSTQQLRKQISNSQFYFELIQQNLQRNIQGVDVDLVCDYILKNSKIQYQCKSLVLNDSRSYSDHQQKLKKAAIQIIVLHRISHCLLYWYYTKATKINGFILLRRQIPQITDSLKFAIALDFLKKYSYKECMEKLCNVRNKIALFQCFRYLLYGRKIIVKGFVMRKNGATFYTISLQNFYDKQFIIKSKQQGQPQFKDVKLTFTMYSRQTGLPFYSSIYNPLQSLSPYSITQLLLSNIIQHQLPKKPLLTLLQTISDKQSQNYPLPPQCPPHIPQLLQPSAQQKDILTKVHKICREKCIHPQLINYVYYLLWFVSILGLYVDFRIVTQYKKAVNVQGKILIVKEMWLGCGIVVQVFRGVGGKWRNYQDVCVYQQRDIQGIRGRVKGENTRIMIKNNLSNSNSIKSSKLLGSKQHVNVSRQQKNRYFTRPQKQKPNPHPKPIHKSNFFQSASSPPSKPQPTSPQLFKHPNLTSSYTCIEPLLQCNPQYFIRRSAYHSRVAIRHPQYSKFNSNNLNYRRNSNTFTNTNTNTNNNSNSSNSNNSSRRLLNKIKKSIIQKQQMEPLEILYKKIIKNNSNNGYVYLCLGYNHGIKAYRVDVYQVENSKRYAAYFKLTEYGIKICKVKQNKQRSQQNKSNSKFNSPHLSPHHVQYLSSPLFPSTNNFLSTSNNIRHPISTHTNHNNFSINRNPSSLHIPIPITDQHQNTIKQKHFQIPSQTMFNNNNGNSNNLVATSLNNNNNYTDHYLPCPLTINNNFNQDKQNIYASSGDCYYLKINGQDQNCTYKQTYPGNNNHNNSQAKQHCVQQQIKVITNIFKQSNKINLSNDHKNLIIQWPQQNTSSQSPYSQQFPQHPSLNNIQIPLFRSYNSLSSFSSSTPGKLQLIQLNNDKLYLLCQLEHHQNLYITVVDQNPFMENVNIFADFQVKQHLVNLYTDLFMRLFGKFCYNLLNLEEIVTLKHIGTY